MRANENILRELLKINNALSISSDLINGINMGGRNSSSEIDVAIRQIGNIKKSLSVIDKELGLGRRTIRKRV